ncbi:MAG: GNAT family N-acetyltransferase [Myxococcales bacterium]
MWRIARQGEDDAIVGMCLELYREDPGPVAVTDAQIRKTLAVLRREPVRGRAVVCELEDRPIGYALLVAFWSNELGGEICEVDELFVMRDHRSQGHGRALFAAIERGEVWPAPPVAIALGVTPGNARARRLYEGLGFRAVGTNMVRRAALTPEKDGGLAG